VRGNYTDRAPRTRDCAVHKVLRPDAALYRCLVIVQVLDLWRGEVNVRETHLW